MIKFMWGKTTNDDQLLFSFISVLPRGTRPPLRAPPTPHGPPSGPPGVPDPVRALKSESQDNQDTTTALPIAEAQWDVEAISLASGKPRPPDGVYPIDGEESLHHLSPAAEHIHTGEGRDENGDQGRGERGEEYDGRGGLI